LGDLNEVARGINVDTLEITFGTRHTHLCSEVDHGIDTLNPLSGVSRIGKVVKELGDALNSTWIALHDHTSMSSPDYFPSDR
jgi:hypothetical protein